MSINMQCIWLVINSYLNLKTYSITFINCFNKVVQQKLNEVLESWKRSKTSWMGHRAWGWNIILGTLHISMGICFEGLGYSNIKMCVGPFVEIWHVLVGGRFWGSCFKAHDFRPTKIGARLPLKHDMFLCRFVPRLTLLVHGNLCWATLKQAIHFLSWP